MVKPWLFISDLHLSAERPQIIDLFVRFTTEIAPQASRLYILGDLLEYWIGDDDEAEGLQTAFDALRQLSDSGVEIYFIAGNRDFLIGKNLARRCGFTLLEEPVTDTYDGHPLLLLHGDSLCTDDVEYMQFRSMVRDPGWQQAFLQKPIQEREAIARSVRDTSKQANSIKDEFIMDVNDKAVSDAMRQAGTELLIHGHTHRPAVHGFMIDDRDATRVVLPDWYETGGYLMLSDVDELHLSEFS